MRPSRVPPQTPPTTMNLFQSSRLLSLALCLCPAPRSRLACSYFPGREAGHAVLTPPTFCLKTCPARALPLPQAPHTPPFGSFSPGSTPMCPCLAPKGSIYLNDFARVVSSDHQAVNGILHFIDHVLLPPDVLHWEPEAAPTPRVCPGHGPGSPKTGSWEPGIVSLRLTSLLTSTFP